MLTKGGGADLVDVLDDEEVVWSSTEDAEFSEEFNNFLTQADVFDILDYLEQTGELSRHEADQCDVVEESYSPAQLAGMF